MNNFAFIDLDRGVVHKQKTSQALIRSFLGGRGLNMLYLARYLNKAGEGAQVDPLGPKNPLIIGTGLLTGSSAPNAARFNVSAKSPETFGLGDANCGGFFAAAMRRAGFDRLIILGQAKEPTYLYLEEGQVHLRSAKNYWGMGSYAAQEAIKAQHGPGTVSAVIGPAGENLVRMACVMTGKKNTAARSGMGAVMGSKNIKAIVAKGKGKLQISDPASLREQRIQLTKYLKSSGVVKILGKVGTPFLYQVSNTLGAIRTRNSQDNYFEDTLNADEIEKFSEKMLACTSCVVHCRHKNTLGGEGPEYSTIGLLGANLGIKSAEQVIELNNLVNELGIDASSAGTIIAWAMELYQRNIIGDDVTDGPLRWGDFERVQSLLNDIAFRRGFGDILAESSQAKRHFPLEAMDYLIAVKDLPQSDPHDVRYIKSFALGIAVASRGADHLRNRPTLDIMRLPDDLRQAIFGVETSANPTDYDGKAGMVAWHDDIYAVVDSLGICKFVTRGFNSPSLLGYKHFTELIQAVTGLAFSEEELRNCGRRVIDLERYITLQLGLTRADDTLPKRYFDDPMPARITKGHSIDRQKFSIMLDEYYAARGWDSYGLLPPSRQEEFSKLL